MQKYVSAGVDISVTVHVCLRYSSMQFRVKESPFVEFSNKQTGKAESF